MQNCKNATLLLGGKIRVKDYLHRYDTVSNPKDYQYNTSLSKNMCISRLHQLNQDSNQHQSKEEEKGNSK